MKTIVRVCMGSACHVKGAHAIAKDIQRQLEEKQLDTEIELMGRFCGNECQKGVVVEGPKKSWYRVELEDVPTIISELMEEG